MLLMIRKIGNSQGVILPKTLLGQIGAADCLEVSLEQGAIVLRRPAVRSGWYRRLLRLRLRVMMRRYGKILRMKVMRNGRGRAWRYLSGLA